MSSEFVAVAIWLFASFAAGAAIGMVLVVAIASHLGPRLAGPGAWMSLGAARLSGLHVRSEEPERHLTIH
jgi:hypothetical protein